MLGCDRGGGGLDNDWTDFGIEREDRRIFAQLDLGGNGGGGKRRAEISGVEAGFFEEEELFVLRLKSGHESLSLGSSENATYWAVGGLFARDGQDRGLGPQRNFLGGELFY
jgi:hypothetical protein